MKKSKIIIAIILIAVIALISISCESNKTFTVYFNSNGGNRIAPLSLKSKAEFKLPEPPQKEGYSFMGWYLDNNTFSIPIDEKKFSQLSVDYDIILYAKWKEN